MGSLENLLGFQTFEKSLSTIPRILFQVPRNRFESLVQLFILNLGSEVCVNPLVLVSVFSNPTLIPPWIIVNQYFYSSRFLHTSNSIDIYYSQHRYILFPAYIYIYIYYFQHRYIVFLAQVYYSQHRKTISSININYSQHIYILFPAQIYTFPAQMYTISIIDIYYFQHSYILFPAQINTFLSIETYYFHHNYIIFTAQIYRIPSINIYNSQYRYIIYLPFPPILFLRMVPI